MAQLALTPFGCSEIRLELDIHGRSPHHKGFNVDNAHLEAKLPLSTSDQTTVIGEGPRRRTLRRVDSANFEY
jgi:hypothetical protein